MNYLAQIILAARNNDDRGWTNILFIVVLVIFYAVGGILKARAKKLEVEEEEEELPEEAAALQEQPQPVYRVPRRPVMRPQPAVHTVGIGAEPVIGVPAVEALTPLSSVEELGRGLRKPLVEEPIAQKVVEEPLIDVHNPEALRKAILHYEILGKPVSLRD